MIWSKFAKDLHLKVSINRVSLRRNNKKCARKFNCITINLEKTQHNFIKSIHAFDYINYKQLQSLLLGIQTSYVNSLVCRGGECSSCWLLIGVDVYYLKLFQHFLYSLTYTQLQSHFNFHAFNAILPHCCVGTILW